MKTIETVVYEFSELTDKAKDKARDWYRTGLEFDAEMEPFETAAQILGISDIKIAYSGFGSQGDGASFTGTYSYAPDAPQAIRAEFGTNETLASIADDLTALQARNGNKLSATVTRSTRMNYVHSYMMHIETHVMFEDVAGDVYPTREADAELLAILRRFADWIYRSLQDDYDYQMSDESVDENIEANEYTFTAEGKRFG